MSRQAFGPPGGPSSAVGQSDRPAAGRDAAPPAPSAPEAAAIVGDDFNGSQDEVLKRVEFMLDQCDALLTHKSNFLDSIPRVAREWKDSIAPLGDIALPSLDVLGVKIQYFDLLHTRDPAVTERAVLGYAAADMRGRVAEVGRWAERLASLRGEIWDLERRIDRAELDRLRESQEEGEES
jgi:hypothetical protein